MSHLPFFLLYTVTYMCHDMIVFAIMAGRLGAKIFDLPLSQNMLQVTARHEARCQLQQQSFTVITSTTVSGSTGFLL